MYLLCSIPNIQKKMERKEKTLTSNLLLAFACKNMFRSKFDFLHI